MYKLDHNKNFLPRNILELNKKFENKTIILKFIVLTH